ncbi:MAG: hypothetical protein K8F62_06230 [Pseudorhodoplanes sp.]|nr:hypothetical protein [Pseudorhodoplanes sp.]
MIAPRQAALELADILQPNEKVIWAAHPDARSILRTKIFLWWLGVPFCAAVFGLAMSGNVSAGVLYPLGLVAFALMAAPFIMLFESTLTIYVITDRRALIARRAPARPPLVACGFEAMDEKLEILETGSGAGHVYFASGWSTKGRDTDYAGKLAFRDVGKAYDVAKLLDKARGKAKPVTKRRSKP